MTSPSHTHTHTNPLCLPTLTLKIETPPHINIGHNVVVSLRNTSANDIKNLHCLLQLFPPYLPYKNLLRTRRIFLLAAMDYKTCGRSEQLFGEEMGEEVCHYESPSIEGYCMVIRVIKTKLIGVYTKSGGR